MENTKLDNLGETVAGSIERRNLKPKEGQSMKPAQPAFEDDAPKTNRTCGGGPPESLRGLTAEFDRLLAAAALYVPANEREQEEFDELFAELLEARGYMSHRPPPTREQVLWSLSDPETGDGPSPK